MSLTAFGIRVAIALGAAAGRSAVEVLPPPVAQGQGVRPACSLQFSGAAALPRALWQMNRDTPLGLKGSQKITAFQLRSE